MKRNKEFWSSFSSEERSFIVYFEKNAKKSYGYGGMLPDDCTECSICGYPCLSSPCDYCYTKYNSILNKLDNNKNRAECY